MIITNYQLNNRKHIIDYIYFAAACTIWFVQLRMQTCSLNPCPDALTCRDELMISCSAAACSLLLYGRLLGCSLNSNGELAIGKGRSADPRT
jgi:hypothetical protein